MKNTRNGSPGLSACCIFFLSVVGATQPSWSQGTLVYDQQSTVSGFGSGGTHIQSSQPVGQSFMPAAAFIGFATLHFGDTVQNNGVGSTVFLSLRENSITGNELAASSPVSLRDSYFGPATFFFSGNVPITTGETYFLVPVLQAGDDSFASSDFYNHGGGTAYFNGQPSSAGLDLWFREGYVVPEPSVVCLTLAGAVVVLSVRHRKLPTR